MRAPRKIQPGDTIGIVSTSSPTTPEAVGRMKAYFEQLGYAVIVAPNTLVSFGYLAGPPDLRAADFNALLLDPGIRMIVTAMGGSGAEQLIPLIDYDAIAADPKFVLGLSNPASLLNAITAKTGVPTFHGPNGVEFGHEVLTPFTEENFWPLVREKLTLPYIFPVADEIRVLRAGAVVEGPLYGGHLKTIQRLIGTPWAPIWKDSVLFLEEYELGFSDMDKTLTHFKLAGVLDQINGLIFGRPVICQPVQAETLEDILLRVCAEYQFPIISNVPIGHTDDKITVPIGCRVRLNTEKPAFGLLESPTC